MMRVYKILHTKSMLLMHKEINTKEATVGCRWVGFYCMRLSIKSAWEFSSRIESVLGLMKNKKGY